MVRDESELTVGQIFLPTAPRVSFTLIIVFNVFNVMYLM